MTPSTTSFEFGDVILVPFPFSDQRGTKQRPAAVISSSTYHRQRPDLIILAITSRQSVPAGESEARVGEWREAGLLKPSTLKPVVTTIARTLVRRRLGRLCDSDRMKLKELLAGMIGD